MKDEKDFNVAKVRKDISELSDSDLMFFSHAIHSETFETIAERVKRIAKEHAQSMPF